MNKVRLAKESDIKRQKELWKRCFGDSDTYIDFYYRNRYKADETIVLLDDEEISAMLTMISVKTITLGNHGIDTAMLYAIATHPNYQNRGFATQLINFSKEYLKANNINVSILVPANKQLFDFYLKQGYQVGFYVRETRLTLELINNLPIRKPTQFTISSITPTEYNQRRNTLLKGRFYIEYADEDIAYQKKLSLQSGTDIYGIDSENIKGCVAIERINSDKVFIKEMIIHENEINQSIKQLTRILSAREYILRLPAYLGEHLGGLIRPFGMIRGHREIDLNISSENLGYLGFAFD